MIPAEDGLYTVIPEDIYHADMGSLSVSGAKLLLPPSCPAKFREQMDHGRKPKKVWDFGHVTHRLVLGKGAEFTVLDPAVHGLKGDGTPSDKPTATAMWKAAEQDARDRGRTPISAADFAKAEVMASKVLSHPIAGPLLADGTAEVSMYHTDADTGVRLRGRADWITADGRLVDYKTAATSNPAELVRNFWKLGYFLQNAWYRDLAEAVGATDPDPEFLFIVQEKEPPHLVQVVRYDADAITEGRRLNRLAIETYAACMEAGVWPGYTDQTVTLSLPGWAGKPDAGIAFEELEDIA